VRVAQTLHAPVETGDVAPVRIDDHHLDRRARMLVDEGRQRLRLVAVVQHVAADDQVEPSHVAHRPPPVAGPVLHGRQMVQAQVLLQEGLGQRVAVTGGDVAPATMDDQAGQRQATTELQDALALQFKGLHGVRQHLP
jgi:hypothetical protein